MSNFHHLGAGGDDDYMSSAPADPLTPAVAEALRGLDVPVPEPIGEAVGPAGAEHLELITERYSPQLNASIPISSENKLVLEPDELRQLVEAAGYALVPLNQLDKVGITEDGPRLRSEDEEEAPAGVNPKDLVGLTKPDLSLVPVAGMLYQSQAMMDGARKYGPYNWRSNPVLMRVYISATMRHLGQLLDGEDFDPLSGVHHVGHALACLGIIADARETGNLVDDRPVKGPAGEMIRYFGDRRSFEGR